MTFQQLGALLPPLTVSSNACAPLTPRGQRRFPKFPAPQEWKQQQPPANPEYAAERARLMLGCYPNGRANDPDTYVAAVAAILSEYPQAVVQRVTDPRTGIARKVKFLPSIAELSEACERALLEVWGPLYRAAREATQGE